MFFITKGWVLRKIIEAVKVERDAHEITCHGTFTYDVNRFGGKFGRSGYSDNYEHKWKSLIGIIKSKDRTIARLKEDIGKMKAKQE